MLTQNGIDYICQNFGNTDFCCINSGLSWYYTYQGIDYPETGATAQIVSRFTLGIIESLTMTSPARGTFTQADLNAANGAPVTLSDAREITYHDEPSEDQWCYTEGPPPPSCSDYTNQADCISVGCYWWSDGTCRNTPEPPPPVCSDYTNTSECIAAGCYWYNNSCHSEPEAPPGWITCYRCKPVGDGYTVPESNEFEGETCPEGWFPTQPPCNLPPEKPFPWWIVAIPIVAGAGIGIGYALRRKK